MIRDTDINTITNARLFKGLSTEIVKDVLAGTSPRETPKSSVLFLEDDKADYLYIVLEGWVKVYRSTPDGDEAVIAVVGAGETIAEANLFANRQHESSAEAVVDARVLPISMKVLQEKIRQTPELAMNLLGELSNHLNDSAREIAKLKTHSGLQRTAEFLLELCTVNEGPAIVALPYEKTLIARKLGMQPESFSRILGKLARLGIKAKSNKIVIPDVAWLRTTSEGGAAEMGIACR